jgi:hypothetical protein
MIPEYRFKAAWLRSLKVKPFKGQDARIQGSGKLEKFQQALLIELLFDRHWPNEC